MRPLTAVVVGRPVGVRVVVRPIGAERSQPECSSGLLGNVLGVVVSTATAAGRAGIVAVTLVTGISQLLSGLTAMCHGSCRLSWLLVPQDSILTGILSELL